eukprot:3472651-Prymnesium_polylepis.2
MLERVPAAAPDGTRDAAPSDERRGAPGGSGVGGAGARPDAARAAPDVGGGTYGLYAERVCAPEPAIPNASGVGPRRSPGAA